MSDGLILVRATVNLARLPAGREAWVDPADPYIAALIRRGLLVPATGDEERP